MGYLEFAFPSNSFGVYTVVIRGSQFVDAGADQTGQPAEGGGPGQVPLPLGVYIGPITNDPEGAGSVLFATPNDKGAFKVTGQVAALPAAGEMSLYVTYRDPGSFVLGYSVAIYQVEVLGGALPPYRVAFETRRSYFT